MIWNGCDAVHDQYWLLVMAPGFVLWLRSSNFNNGARSNFDTAIRPMGAASLLVAWWVAVNLPHICAEPVIALMSRKIYDAMVNLKVVLNHA